jgi:hypothetical protein
MNEHGWRYQDEAARDLRIPPSHFNMTIYRARQQLREQGVGGSNPLTPTIQVQGPTVVSHPVGPRFCGVRRF